MITKATIKKQSRSITYQRGLDIYRANDIMDFDLNEYVDELGDEISEIRAFSSGSYNNAYEVNITVNESTSEIVDSYCECPAFDAYPGLCKHCVATLLEYLDKRIKSKMSRAEQDLERLLGMLGVQKGTVPEKNRKRETSEKVKKMLTQFSLRENAVFLPESKHGQVKLEPSLHYDYGTLKLKLKIGISHMYVVKSIPQFVFDLKELHTVSYGKNLEFLHCMEAFDEDSKKIARFLMKFVDTPQTQYYRNLGIVYRGETKELKLEGYWLDEFMELLEEREISVEYQTNEGVEKGIYRISYESPKEEITVRGVEDGVFLEPTLMEYVNGQEYSYYITETPKGMIYKVSMKEMEEIESFLTYLREDSQGEVFVGKEDLPAFCQNLLPVMEKYFDIEQKNFSPELYQPPKVEFETYLDAPQKDMISCRAYAVYDEKKYSLFAQNGVPEELGLRDVQRESQVKGMLGQFFYAYDSIADSMALQGEDDIYHFLTAGIDVLRTISEVYVSEQLKRMQVVQRVKFQVGVSLTGDTLHMQIGSQEFTKTQLAEILSRYEQKKKYYRLKTGEFVQMDENEIRVLQDLRDNFQLTDKQLRQEDIVLPTYRALYLDGQLRSEGFQVKKNREFKQLIRDMKTTQDSDFEVPDSLEGILREYQKSGFSWMKTLCRNHFGGILADDMGLGKTLQTITFLLSEFEEVPKGEVRQALIVTPASLVYNWKSEFETFAPGLPVYVVTGTVKEREQLLKKLRKKPAVMITSYQLLHRDEEIYEKLHFKYQVIDEAQFIKNQGNQTTRAVKAVKADFRIALTGTPVENRLSELWSIFDYVMPGFLYRYQRFKKEIESPIIKSQDEETMNRLQKMIQPFILRRTKSEVLKELPDKIEKCMYAQLEGEQWQLYSARVQRLSMQLNKQSDEEFSTSKIEILSELTRLRQICCDPALIYENYTSPSAKLDLCMELIRNAVEGGHKILLFSQYTSMLELIIRRLEADDTSYYLLTGKTPKETRTRMASQFNQDDTSVFCISLKAGGTGLNLTGADMVIHYDPWWNAAVETQATDRAHRIGQKQVVTVYKLIARQTIEEKIVDLQSKKKELASQVLGGEGISQASLSREDLMELLKM
ncbi:MAG: DEAD/DEAH box helicase [Clostridia bacterium]|nr:DEAD/DEAH box helicase [Clostridia bacterium]NCC44093.1 DEAD/DEAH box helicase [Clostridia bacterium]